MSYDADRFREANEAKTKLEAKMKSLGERLRDLGTSLQNPKVYVFDVDDANAITVGQPGAGRRQPVTRVTPSDIDWKDLCETLRRFNQAKEDKRQAVARLNLGVDIAD